MKGDRAEAEMIRLDPRTRLAIGASAVGAVLGAVHMASFLAGWMLLLLFATAGGQLRSFGKSLRMTFPLAAFVFVVGLIFYEAETALFLAVRLFVLFSVSAAVFGQTDAAVIGDALRLLGFPYGVAFMVTSGMRYVPLIGLKVQHIIEAQKSRGIDLAFRLRNMKNLVALLMPLLVQAFVLAEDMAVAMESRGFGRKHRSFRKRYRFGLKDWGVTVACFVSVAAFLCWERGWL
ncbi:MAG TPA: energy-coupling factor transporter transmembrane protein EcfT [Desulfobacteraceae bacterium]|nr:energy-coupling factor transporter transmembrane protein EcfT [Desulfobacteraceae bacterium]